MINIINLSPPFYYKKTGMLCLEQPGCLTNLWLAPLRDP